MYYAVDLCANGELPTEDYIKTFYTPYLDKRELIQELASSGYEQNTNGDWESPAEITGKLKNVMRVIIH